MKLFTRRVSYALCATLATGLMAAPRHNEAQPNVLPLPASKASTVPPNGDVNPYGVAFVPRTVPSGGSLMPGGILVSNFNNAQNLQGTGTTIVQISPQGATSVFYQSSRMGLSGALGILSNGVVIAGYLPTVDGTSATAGAGGLLFIDRHGKLLGSLNGPPVNGPWGMAVHDRGEGEAQVFVSNVLDGTVVRFDLIYGPTGESVNIVDSVTVGSGFTRFGDPAALEVGPSGLAFDAAHDILYVASEADSAVYAIGLAGTRTNSAAVGVQIYQDSVHLHGPLDLAMAPNGHLLVANSDGHNADPNQPSELVEFTTGGEFVSQYSLDPNNGGAFGLAIDPLGGGAIRVAAVDDNANSLSMWTTIVK